MPLVCRDGAFLLQMDEPDNSGWRAVATDHGALKRLIRPTRGLADTLLAFVTLASIQIALRRLARG